MANHDSVAATSGVAVRHILGRSTVAFAMCLLSCTALISPASAQETVPATPATPSASADAAAPDEIVVTGSLGALPLKNVGSIFGFDKTIVETPRSASTISSEQMERFGVTQIYDLVSQVPGTFTNSYFGTGGAVDIRGSPADVYFRGIRRLDNPGNYPTPIGSSDRIDIVRGPSSPIYGPSKTGGYINFVPKSARAANGSYATEASGYINYTRSSWNGNVVKADITGPAKIGDHEFGYSLYGEVQDAGSYYRNIHTNQTILQASFDTDITSSLRTEFGGMYHHFSGEQNGGWNRLTQDLVDHGTYITGAAKPLDTNGDGQISRAEAGAANGGQGLNPYGSVSCGNFDFGADGNGPANFLVSGFNNNACYITNYPDLALTNSGTTKLSRKDTLTGPNDYLKNSQKTAYFDLIWEGSDTLQIKNQLFYDRTDNHNANDYGFSQFIHSYVVEDKIVASDSFTNSAGKFSFQASPSIRYTKFFFGDDFDVEEFSRVDLTKSYDATSNRLLSVECGCDYTDYLRGHYTDYGMAGLADLDFDFGLDIVLGGRYDYTKAVTGVADPTKYDPADLPAIQHAKGHDDGWSWNASASYELPFGIRPYVTASRQSTIVVGEGSELYPDAVAANNFIAASKLYEAGIKGEFLDKRLYAAVSVYKQSRTDFNNQNSVTNQSVKTKGVEAEVRWSVDRHLLVSGAYTLTNVYELSALRSGSTFSFYGIEDLKNFISDPTLYLGGQPIGNLHIDGKDASRRAGIPKNLYSATATYAFDNGIAISGDVSHVESVYSGQSQAVKLPAYWLANVGVSYKTGPFLFRVVVKNVNDAHYFRANFTELFGSTIALPEVPRNFQATIEYKF